MNCPDDVGLERLLLGLATAEERTHAAACAACQTRLIDFERQGEDFHRFVYPRTVDAVVASARWGWRRPSVWGLSAAALAAAAIALLVGVPLGPSSSYVGVKGESLNFTVYTVDATGAAVRLSDGATVQPSAPLRFRLRTSRPCHLWLLSVDGHGAVSRLFPPSGEATRIEGEATLPGGATLDGETGPERLVAVCMDVPKPYAEVAEAARRAMASRVREETLLPFEGLQSSVLLEKAR